MKFSTYLVVSTKTCFSQFSEFSAEIYRARESKRLKCLISQVYLRSNNKSGKSATFFTIVPTTLLTAVR